MKYKEIDTINHDQITSAVRLDGARFSVGDSVKVISSIYGDPVNYLKRKVGLKILELDYTEETGYLCSSSNYKLRPNSRRNIYAFVQVDSNCGWVCIDDLKLVKSNYIPKKELYSIY